MRDAVFYCDCSIPGREATHILENTALHHLCLTLSAAMFNTLGIHADSHSQQEDANALMSRKSDRGVFISWLTFRALRHTV